MSNISISIPHQLTRVEARQRVEELVSQLQKQYGGMVGQVDQRWEADTLSFTFSAVGQSVSGKIHVEVQAVRMDVALPWPLNMLAGGVKQRLEQEGQKLLARK